MLNKVFKPPDLVLTGKVLVDGLVVLEHFCVAQFALAFLASGCVSNPAFMGGMGNPWID